MTGARTLTLVLLLLGATPLVSSAEAQQRRERPRQAEPAPRTPRAERPAERPAARPAARPERKVEPKPEPRRAEPEKKPAQAPRSTGEPELRRRKP